MKSGALGLLGTGVALQALGQCRALQNTPSCCGPSASHRCVSEGRPSQVASCGARCEHSEDEAAVLLLLLIERLPTDWYLDQLKGGRVECGALLLP